eukprot:TRINITY_DN19176_c0_g1_i2.p1 TRINITY_DN19176_c0_g1~~TRINITY_DN19176_c0_g1_i2.p1  ORF type:complete len:257 (+),score=30.65 TRINITY_DN19176_c0_g1_i2:48-773(+)
MCIRDRINWVHQNISKMRIRVRISEKPEITFNVYPNDTIKQVKLKLEEKTAISWNNQKLVYIVKALENEKTLTDYNICDMANINFVFKSGGERMIYIKTLTGKQISLCPSIRSTIKDVKHEIYEKTGIDPCKQILFFKGQQLEDNIILIDYSIQSRSTLHLLTKFRSGMQIFLKTLTGRVVAIDVDPNNTIEELKDRDPRQRRPPTRFPETGVCRAVHTKRENSVTLQHKGRMHDSHGAAP